jgi:hypothetical protein
MLKCSFVSQVMMAQAGSSAHLQIILVQRTKPVQTPFTPAEEMKFRWPVTLLNIVFVVTV